MLLALGLMIGVLASASADVSREGRDLGPIADHLLDRSGKLTIEQIVGPEGERLFVKANGRVANYGPRPNPEAVLWLRIALPVLDPKAAPAWSLAVTELRIRKATLFIAGPEAMATHVWDGEVLHRSPDVNATRFPIFLLDAEAMSGRVVYLKIETASSMRALASLRPAKTALVAYTHEALMFGVAVGILGGLALYLLATGWAMRDRSALMLSAFAFSYLAYMTAHQALLETHLLPGSLDLSRIVSLSATVMLFATRLLFMDAFLELKVNQPRISRITRSLAGLLVVIAIGIAVDIGLHGQTVMRKYTALMGITGLVWSLFVLTTALRHVPRRVLIYVLCWGPVIASGLARLALDAFPKLGVTPLSLNATYVFTCIGFLLSGIVTGVEMHRRERERRKGLEAMRQRINDIALSASDSFWETDEAGKIAYLSGPVVERAGLKPGLTLIECLRAFEGSSALPDLFASRAPFVLRLAEHRADESTLRLELRGKPYVASENGQIGFRGVISDVTVESLRQEQESRQQRLAAVGQLAGSIAHDINNLLHPIISLTRRAAADLPEADKRRQWLDTVVDAGARAAEIVSGLLASVRPVNGVAEQATLAEGVRRALNQLQPVKPEGVTLSFSKESEGPLMPINEVFQIIVNLVSNAIYATHGNGTIAISIAAAPDGKTQLIVADDGVGMDEEIRRKALEPFFSGRIEGTGLGLSIVNAIAKRHGGTVDINGAPGEGTRITLLLPPGQSAKEEASADHGA